MGAVAFIRAHPDYYTKGPKFHELWAEVYSQARTHMDRNAYGDLFEKMRPNESEDVQTYREDNYRQLTRSDVDRFISKVSRYFKDSGISIVGSDSLLEWVGSKPFYEMGQEMSFEEYLLFFIFAEAIKDSNGMWLAWPYFNEGVPPAYSIADGGLPPSEKVKIKSLLIPSKDIKFISKDVFSWFGGTLKFGNKTRKYYYIADSEGYYRYFPKLDKDTPAIFEDWYKHDFGFVPLNILPGQPNSGYHESFLRPYFEYADEFVNRFSDAQAVWVRHSYPKPIIQEMDCPECKGAQKIRDNVGNLQTCSNCQGTGQIRDIGPYSVLVRPSGAGIDHNNTAPVLEYVTPDSSILEHAYTKPFDILERGRRAIGLDLLIKMNESGVAMDVRLEDLQDLLGKIGEALFACGERFLRQVEGLLVLGSKEDPRIKRPVSYSIRTPNMLKESADAALPSDRLSKTLEYFDAEYKNDPPKLWAQTMAVKYSPLLLLDTAETQQRLAIDFDNAPMMIAKRDYAVWAFTELTGQAGYDGWTTAQAFQNADKFLTEAGILSVPVPIA